MSFLPLEVVQQIKHAYRLMAERAQYRPAAPSDGFGNITTAPQDLDLEAEMTTYVTEWWREEDARTFHVGCCNAPTRPATIFAVEAARALCGTNDELALRLLHLAIENLFAVRQRKRPFNV